MLYMLIHNIRDASRRVGFEDYLNSLQRTGFAIAPSVAEARKDYQRLHRPEPTPIA